MFEGVVATLLNRFLGNYVTNLETTQLKLGIWQGDVKLEKLRLKKDALDKLRLPVDIKEGWLGTLTISIPWSNLKGEPVRISVDNVYVLATPRFQENFDPEREDEREFKRKMRKLETDDLMRQQQLLKSQVASGEEGSHEQKKQASFTEQLITKIVDNLQIVIKNIHVRYEDNISNPSHLFAVGATLGELSAVSTDEEWRQTFLHDSGNVIRKMLKLAQFSMYWDTDCETLQGLDHEALIAKFAEAIRSQKPQQSILQPVVGTGKLTLNKRPTPEDIRTMANFEFDQLAFELDDDQYADALLLTTAFDYAMRQHRYRKHRPSPGVRPKDDPRAWLMFAFQSVYDEVHDHNRRKTKEFLLERRDDRLLYIRIYTMAKINNGILPETDRIAFDLLHRKLSYQDIRFYRARAEPHIKRQKYLISKRKEEDNKTAKGSAGGGGTASSAGGSGDGSADGGGITGWVGGWLSSWVASAPTSDTSTSATKDGDKLLEVGSPKSIDGMANLAEEGITEEDTQLNEKQIKELYDTIDFNEDMAGEKPEYDLPQEAIKFAASAILRSGSLSLKVDRKTRDHTLMGFKFDMLKFDMLQRPKNIVADLSMHRFEVVDGTLPNTQYPRMIYVQSDEDENRGQKDYRSDDEHEMLTAVPDAPGGLQALAETNDDNGGFSDAASRISTTSSKLMDPFLKVHFEKDPLDGHADSMVSVKVKSLNVIFHPTAARSIVNFFEPPSSASAESMHALIAAASKSVAGFRDQTRAGLEYALAKHKTVDVKVDFDAPVFVIPQDVLDPHSEVVVLDTGYLTIESRLVDNETTERLRQRQKQVLSAEDMKEFESLMYDHFDMKLHSTQLLVGNDLATCMQALKDGKTDRKLHVVDRIELNFNLGLCILSKPPLHMPKVTVDGSLPSLQVFFSDRKYKAIMGCIDLIIEAIDDEEDIDITEQYETRYSVKRGTTPAVTTAFGAGGIFLSSPDPDSNNAPDPAMILEANNDRGSPSSSSSMSGYGNGDDEGDDEFYETTDKIDSTSGNNSGSGRDKAGGGNELRRKAVDQEQQVPFGKEPDRIKVKVNFSVDNLVGFIWRTHTDGRDDLHLADIAVTGLAVECINRPYDLFADVTIHQVTVEDHLMVRGISSGNNTSGSASPSQRVYALTSDIAQADANGETGKNLVVVKYHRCQADHPEFTTTYESIGQTVDVDISYLDLMVVRKTILTAYDYILKTFTNEDKDNKKKSKVPSSADNKSLKQSGPEQEQEQEQEQDKDHVGSLIQEALDTIRVDVRFKGTDFGLCHDDGAPIALLSVTAATMRVIVTEQVLVEAKIGNITLADQLDLLPMQTAMGVSNVPGDPNPMNLEQRQYGQYLNGVDPRRLLLYVKGDELADFRYETFDPNSPSFPGHNAAIKLRLGAAHLTFIERPIRELMLFGSRFTAMHGLFEAARQAAAYGTSQLTEEMMGGTQKYHFDVVMSAPTITFPRDGLMPYNSTESDGNSHSSSFSEATASADVDVLIAQPGELTISNEFTTVREMGKDWDVNHVSLALRRIGIKTIFAIEDDPSEHGTFGQPGQQVLQILEDVDYHMDMHILMQGHITGCPRPVTELIGKLSPIKMKLTEYQYKMVYDLLMVIARVFGNDPNAPVIPDPLIGDRVLDLDVLRENPATKNAKDGRQALVNLGQITDPSKNNSNNSADTSAAAIATAASENAGQYATIDLYVTLSTIQLELFRGNGFSLDDIQEATFTRMDINGLSVKYRSKANGDSKAELAIIAVRAYDTRSGTENQFTQIISPTIASQQQRSKKGKESSGKQQQPTSGTSSHASMHAMAQDAPVEEDVNNPQLICHIDMRPNQDMVVLVTLDSPRIILVLDHAFLLLGFATSVFPQQDNTAQVQKANMGSSVTSASTVPDPSTTGGLIYKVEVLHPEIILLADPKSRASEALILSINQIILAQEGMFCATMDEIGVQLCSIDKRQETSRSVMDPFTIITTMDSKMKPADPRRGVKSHQVTDISVDVGNLLLRLGLNDIVLMLDIFNTAMELMNKKDDTTTAEVTSSSSSPVTATASTTDMAAGRRPRRSSTYYSNRGDGRSVESGSTKGSAGAATRSSAFVLKETMRATISSFRIVVIRDMFGLPVYACTAKEFHVDITDWSVNMRVKSDIRLQASYFNRRNSHWEPFIEPWSFALNMAAGSPESNTTGVGDTAQKIDISSSDRLLVNASHAFIEETLGFIAQWGDEVGKREENQKKRTSQHVVGERMPYVLINRTGIDCHVWVDLPEGATPRSERIDTTPVLLKDGESLPWRFEDWRRRREQLEAKSHHLGIQFANGQWEWLRRVQVDREGVKHYMLVPAIDDIQHRVAVEVKLDAVNLVKRVVLRSPLVVENQTKVAMEVAMCDYRGELRTDSAVIQPGEDLPLPIMFCHQYGVSVRPESGFGYAWSSQYIFWRNFLAQDPRAELCCLPQSAVDPGHPHQQQQNRRAAKQSSDGMPFYVHFNALCDLRNPILYKYPFMRLVMTPPMEIENLLPYPVNLFVLDKTANRRWSTSLQRGGSASVHAVQPGNLVMLKVLIPEAGFERCEGSIIETNDDDDYPTDDNIIVTDRDGAKLELKLHRMDIPNSGGQCRRISIYAPYVMVNRTGMKLYYSSKGFFKGMSAVAGQNAGSNTPLPPTDSRDDRSDNIVWSSGGVGTGNSEVANEFVRNPPNLDSVTAGNNNDAVVAHPLMFSFGSYDLRNRALVRASDSEWSRPLSFDALGSSAEVTIPKGDKIRDIHLGINIEPGRGRYSHTRVVTFTSRYVIKNLTGLPLQYRTVYNTETSVLLNDGERKPLHTIHRARRRLLTIANALVDGEGRPRASVRNSRWSAPFSIDDVGRMFVRLPGENNDRDEEEVLLKIDIVMDGASLFVILQREKRYWPYMIENNTQVDITVWQYQEKHGGGSNTTATSSTTAGYNSGRESPLVGGTNSGSASVTPEIPAAAARLVSAPTDKKYLIRAGERLNYTWDVPTAANKLLVVSAQKSTRRVSLQEIGEQRPFVYGKPPLPLRRNTATSTVSMSGVAAVARANKALMEHTMNIEVVASGARQVLKLTSYTPEHSLYMPQIQPSMTGISSSPTQQPRTTTQASAVTRSPTQQSSSTSSNDDGKFEVVAANEKTNYIYRVGFEGGIGVSLINKYSSEILFATLADVELKFTDSTSNQTYKLTAKWIQIDNQIYGAVFPIVLYPTTLGATNTTNSAGIASPPALQAVVVHAKDNSYGVEYFKYASVLAQEMSVELDEDFLYALLDFVKFDVPQWESGQSDEDTATGMHMLESDIPEIKAFDEGLQLYFEFLHIQPFKLNISFMRTQRLEVGGDPTTARYPVVAAAAAAQSSSSRNNSNSVSNAGPMQLTGEGIASNSGVVAYAMNILTMAIGNINEAPVFLNALVMQNVRVSMPILLDRMHKHYSQEVFNQVYKVVGSANLLGNPVGLFNNISSGVSDFFYEPYQGFVMSDRPQDFGFGLARGTASLFKKTVFGMTDSFSKFTDSMSKGLSAATMDPRYQTERSMSRVRNKPKHAIYGVARGAESFAKSVSSGLAGVVMRPLEGAEQEGVGGFFKGMGKGLVGVVTKPVIGMFDLASNVTEGIRNTTTVFERDLDRQRLPRHISRDGIITPYSSRESLGQAWMRELHGGAYALDSYLAHLELPRSDMVVLLTYQRLIMFRRSKPDDAGMTVGAAGSSSETGNATGSIGVSAANASKAHVEWEQEIKSLHSIQLESTGITLKLPATPEGYTPPGPFIPISDAGSRRWFYDQIREAVKALSDLRKELG